MKVRLDKLLLEKKLAPTRQKAQALIPQKSKLKKPVLM